MNRRTFLAAIAALPFVGRFVTAEPEPVASDTYSFKLKYKRSTTGDVPSDHVRIYGDDAHLYSSTGPWYFKP